MPQNPATSAPKITDLFTAPSLHVSTNKSPKTAGDSYRMRSSWSPKTKPNELNSSMVAALPQGSIGVLLPICLLAVFLSCVVCVYHWQSTRERRLDMEDDRKRKMTLSEFKSGCASRTQKSGNKNKVRGYAWRASARIQELPDINNNDTFVIPTFLEMRHDSGRYYGDSSRHSALVGHQTGHHKRPVLKRPCIHKKKSYATGDQLGFSYSSEAELNLSVPSSWSADTAEGCDVLSARNENPGFIGDVINEDLSHVTGPGDQEVVAVETMNGTLLEYWV